MDSCCVANQIGCMLSSTMRSSGKCCMKPIWGRSLCHRACFAAILCKGRQKLFLHLFALPLGLATGHRITHGQHSSCYKQAAI